MRNVRKRTIKGRKVIFLYCIAGNYKLICLYESQPLDRHDVSEGAEEGFSEDIATMAESDCGSPCFALSDGILEESAGRKKYPNDSDMVQG
ncbi:unnamed protein product [Adineta ricciae]|uniref:Uncharacterized protein n=1 Tax=Adineta ricciae TaxID=249248 RepID=A0A815JBV2_ADIRI|nr:unnamed protein product [Adineta ricciae]